MDTRKIIALVLAAFAAFGAFKGGGIVPGPSLDGVSAVAAGVHKERAKRQAIVYREAAAKVKAGQFKDGTSLGNFLIASVASIEVNVDEPLRVEAKKSLPEKAIDKPDDVAAWLESAAKGFDAVAK